MTSYEIQVLFAFHSGVHYKTTLIGESSSLGLILV